MGLKWISLFIVVASQLAILYHGVNSHDTEELSPAPVVQTPNGLIEGTFDGISRSGRKFYQFRGIQYALVQERFKPSIELQPWEGSKIAKTFGPDCGTVRLHGEENCLYLNVYTPRLPSANNKASKRLPVLVFIHGGFYNLGTSNSHHGPNYFLDEDVIFVTFHYRTGVLGYLSTGDEYSPGNFGLKDQVMALKWVQKNIQAFGGDKNQVTIMGQSTGAMAVTFHLLSPMSKGLFHRAIAQSGSFLSPLTVTRQPLRYAKRAAELANCTDTTTSKAIVNCLKTIPVKNLACGSISIVATVKFLSDPVDAFGPTIEPLVGDGSSTFLSENPYQLLSSGKISTKVPLLTGFTKEEGLLRHAMPLLYNSRYAAPHRKNLEQNWTTVAPIAFYFEEAVPKERYEEVGEKIKNFYFKSGFSLDNVDSLLTPLTQLYSDRFFVNSGVKFINLYSKIAPTFPYLYTFNKYHSLEHSEDYESALDGKTFDATFGSDLDVLISPLNNETRDKEDHNKLSQSIVKLWVSFVNKGAPTATYGSERNFPAVDPAKGLHQFYGLDEDTKLIENIYSKRIQFWESLQLNDTEYEKLP